jgi:hypothetical protein
MSASMPISKVSMPMTDMERSLASMGDLSIK